MSIEQAELWVDIEDCVNSYSKVDFMQLKL